MLGSRLYSGEMQTESIMLVSQQTRKNACQLLVLSLLTRSDSRIIVEGEAGEGWDRVAGYLE